MTDTTNPARKLHPRRILAPWPSTKAQVTAESLAWSYAASAQISFGAAQHFPTTDVRWGRAIESAVESYAVAFMLRAWHESYPVAANHQAKQLWHAIEMGDVAAESVWDWLNEWGIDATALRQEGERYAKEMDEPHGTERLRSVQRELRLQSRMLNRGYPDTVERLLSKLTKLTGELDGPVPERTEPRVSTSQLMELLADVDSKPRFEVGFDWDFTVAVLRDLLDARAAAGEVIERG